MPNWCLFRPRCGDLSINGLQKVKTLESQGILEPQKVLEYVSGELFDGPQKCKMCSDNGSEAQSYEKAADNLKSQESTTCCMEIHAVVQDNEPKFCSTIQDDNIDAIKIHLDEDTDMHWRQPDPSLQQGDRTVYNQQRWYQSKESCDRINIEVAEEQPHRLSNIMQSNVCHYCNEAVAEKSRSSTEHSRAAIPKCNNKIRVIIHMQFQSSSVGKQFGKLIVLPDSIEELLSIAGKPSL